MLQKLTARIESFLTERINEIEVQHLAPDRQYQELNTKINDVLDRIGHSLPPGNERLLFELDDFWVERDVLAYQRMYRQGLMDGIVTNRVLRMVRRCCRK
jgi:hypothetical protein